MRCVLEETRVVFEVPSEAADEESVKYAAYVLTDAAFARLETMPGGLRVLLEPKTSDPAALRRLADRFPGQLEEERLRTAIEENNRGIREHIIRLALQGPEAACAPPEDLELTAEQRQELDKIIAEVQDQIRMEKVGGGDDPLGITVTWEEGHAERRDAE